MSLQLAAQHMASRGRGPDTQLVHMAPQEVAGLQALAKAHGGSLTTNPDTGLPEAGFLSSILPMVAGAFLGPAGLGLSAIQSGLAAGALGTLATGSLKKGLMAGLGAYGGAGLAGGLMGAGAEAAQQAAMANASNIAPGIQGTTPAMAGGFGEVAPVVSIAPPSATLGATVANPTGIPGFTGTGLGLTPPPAAIQADLAVKQAMPQVITDAVPQMQLTEQGMLNQAAADATKKFQEGSTFDQLSSGAKEVWNDPKKFLTKDNLMYAGAAAAPFLFQEPEQKARKEEKPYEYGFNYNRVANPYANRSGAQTGEVMHFNPTFTRTAAGGGLMDLGPVEAMSNRNEAETLMANGGQMFAEGGETKAVGKVEDNPFYTMTGQSGDAFKYLMGQGPRAAAAPATAPAAAVAPVATPASVVNNVGLDNSYVFNPSTGGFSSIGETVRTITPSTALQYYTSGGDSANTGVTPQQAAVFDFMNTPAGQSYKDDLGRANSALIGSLMPGSIVVSALKGQDFKDPITAFRDANKAYSLAEQAANMNALNSQAERNASMPGFNPNWGGGLRGTLGDQEGDYPTESGGGGGYDHGGPGPAGSGSTGGGLGGVGGEGTPGANGPGDGTAADYARGGLAALARGGMSHLGDYSDGGRLLRGPGDGVSDSIPASIGDKRPARLADGEFVVPARIVSELGNGSTEAGARKLYAMMDRVQKARGKTVGKDRVAVNSRAEKLLPA